jgi:cytosine/adenosine deaminase-related metal-dependent hydrolase
LEASSADDELQFGDGRAAVLLGLTDRGVLGPGKLADFVVVTANSLDDISNTQKIAAGWRRKKKVGKRSDRVFLAMSIGNNGWSPACD